MAYQDLIDYIKKEEAEGYRPEQLKRVLLNEGWSSRDIDEAIRYAYNVDTTKAQYFGKEDYKKYAGLKKERPLGITVIAVLYIAGGILSIVSGLSVLLSNSSIITSIPSLGGLIYGFTSLITIFFLGLAAVNIIVGFGLLKLKNWARIIALVYSILSLLTIIGIPIGAVFIYILVNKDTKEAFVVNKS